MKIKQVLEEFKGKSELPFKIEFIECFPELS